MTKSNKVVPFKRAKRTRKSPVSGTVPNRKANDALRTRSHLTEKEVERLLKVAKQGRYGQRDHLMVLMAFRHGLRVSELCDLQWTDIEFRRGTVHVRRLKGSKDSTHYLEADESPTAQGAPQSLRVALCIHLRAWWADECSRIQEATVALGCEG